jgi:hypothetical protein
MNQQKPFWITATELKKITGFNHDQMRAIRANNPDLWKQKSKKSFLYNANAIPEVLRKKTA